MPGVTSAPGVTFGGPVSRCRRYKPRKNDPTLFETTPTRAKTARPKPRHLHSVEQSQQGKLNRDGATLLLSDIDGLIVRSVKPHSAKKARMVRRDLATVGRAMNRQWFAVHYLELFSGPGRLLDEATGEEIPGSPLEALEIPTPFDRYVFSDFDESCVAALDRRIGARSDVRIRRGDANDPRHLETVAGLLDPRALIIAYLDPAKPNLHFDTVAWLANRFEYIDFIINLPTNAIHRSLAAARYWIDRGANPATLAALQTPAGALGHPDPLALLGPDECSTADAIRGFYYEQLRNVGMTELAEPRTICVTQNNAPLYDIILASRHPRAVELWEKANKVAPHPQLALGEELI
jgi:three-Cys-motif partner protein